MNQFFLFWRFNPQGDDTLDGGLGGDTFNGNKCNDFLSGNTGTDTIIAGPGNDILRGRNSFLSDSQPDSFNCGQGTDVLDDFDPTKGDTKSADCK